MRNLDGTFKVGHKITMSHGMTSTRVYRIWDGMKRRCLNPNQTGYESYGAKGIKVSKEWMTFINFFNDMGNPPTGQHSLDRIDGTKGYYNGNCRWATRREQQANTKSNVNMTLNGLTLNQSEWSRKTGLSISTIRTRLRCKWSIEETLTKPSRLKISKRPKGNK